MDNIRQIWPMLIEPYSLSKYQSSELLNELLDAYSGPSRHYHGLDHINYMLALCNEHKENLKRPELVLWAILFHDVIYSSTKKDNELQSAELAKTRLTTIGLNKEDIDEVFEMIMATKSHQFNSNKDINYLLDFDLAILGSDLESYQTYAGNVRKEYKIYPKLVYNPGRKKALKAFVDRPFIYQTEFFRSQLEQTARDNIAWEIQSL